MFPGEGVDSKPFRIRYSPSVFDFPIRTLSELEQVTATYLDFYLGLAFGTPDMADINFLNTIVRQTGFVTPGRNAPFTSVTFEVTAKFDPTRQQPTIPDERTITRMVEEAFTTTTDPDWVSIYIARLRGLPPRNGFRDTTSVTYVAIDGN
jgi:hypothetical protein